MHPTLRALLERNLIVCVGPLARAPGLAGPREYVDVCRGALGSESTGQAELWAQPVSGGISRMLERAEALLGGARFVRLVRPHLDRGDARPSLVARALATLAPTLPCICTTNLDATLERVLGNQWPVFEVEPPDLAARAPFLMKMCGTASRVSTWVLGERQLAVRPDELSQLGRILRSHELLLVGFDADDEPLRRLVLDLRGRLAPGQAGTGASVALVPAASVTAEARAFFAAYGVALEPVAGDYSLVVAEWLHWLAAAFEKSSGKQLPRYIEGEDLYASHDGLYPGLVPFSHSHARHFCGREAEAQRVQNLLRARPRSRWLVVHGPEDIGKTSFVMAGLLPMLAPKYNHYPPEPGVAVGSMRPGREPLLDLARALPYEIRRHWEPNALVTHLKSTPRALTDLLVRGCPDGFILIVDPLDGLISKGERDEREAFAAALAHAVAYAPDPFLLITAMTSELFGEMHRLPRLYERLHDDDSPVIYGLAPLDADQLRRVIAEPARRAGYTAAARLVDRVLADIERLADSDDPPSPGRRMAMIAAALSETRRRSKHRMLCEADYEAAGGLAGAVDALAEAAIASALAELGEPFLRRIVLVLLDTSADGRLIRRAVDLDSITHLFASKFPKSDREQRRTHTARILHMFGSHDGANRVLVVRRDRVVLVHDALLHNWARLRRWVAEDPAKRVVATDSRPKPKPNVDVHEAGVGMMPARSAAQSTLQLVLRAGRPIPSQPYIAVPEVVPGKVYDPDHLRIWTNFPLPQGTMFHPPDRSLQAPSSRRPAWPRSGRRTSAPQPAWPPPAPRPSLRRLQFFLIGFILSCVGGFMVSSVASLWPVETVRTDPPPRSIEPVQVPPSVDEPGP